MKDPDVDMYRVANIVKHYVPSGWVSDAILVQLTAAIVGKVLSKETDLADRMVVILNNAIDLHSEPYLDAHYWYAHIRPVVHQAKNAILRQDFARSDQLLKELRCEGVAVLRREEWANWSIGE